MTEQDKAEIETVVRRAVADQFRNAADAFLPIIEVLLEIQKSAGMLIDGQALIEKHIGGAFDGEDDGEPWRESLDGED